MIAAELEVKVWTTGGCRARLTSIDHYGDTTYTLWAPAGFDGVELEPLPVGTRVDIEWPA